MSSRARPLLLALLLAALTVAAFAPVRSGTFLTVDDPLYVVENPRVRAGLTGPGVLWALTTTHAANWHPLTWVSHMLDVQLFGLDPGAHHQVSLALHAANAVLLFLLLRGLTGAAWPSALAAALFAVHPLRVESVAWIAERKDVLAAFFWMATGLAYLRYVRSRRRAAYGATVALFALGLAAKPMVTTLPLVLLLLDFWPLGRFLPGRRAAAGGNAVRLLVEKLPLLALSAAAAAATLVAQEAGRMVRPLAAYPLGVRAGNALVSYLRYLGKTVWPVDLAFPYRHPGTSLPPAAVAAAAAALVLLTVLALALRRRTPYLAVGWLWFLGTLVPVIGLVQVSDQAMADRYTYLPLIGPAWALAWGLAAAGAGRPRLRAGAGAAAAVAVGVLVVLTRRQVGYWRDDRSLFTHTAAVTKGDNLARQALATTQQALPDAGRTLAVVMIQHGDGLMAQGKYAEAIAWYERSLGSFAEQDTAHNRLGAALLQLGRYEEAARQYEEALRREPGDEFARANLTLARSLLGQRGGAGDGRQVEEHNRLGAASLHNEQFAEAAGHYAAVVQLRPGDAMAHANLGLALKLQGRLDEAAGQFREALRLDPQNGKARQNLEEIGAGGR
jgi:tetratricopeptide (TPR) repeat protein